MKSVGHGEVSIKQYLREKEDMPKVQKVGRALPSEYLECREWCNVRKSGGFAQGQQAIMARGKPWLNVGFSIIVSNLISLIQQQDAGTF